MNISALPGYEITSVGVEESGEYLIFGDGEVEVSSYFVVQVPGYTGFVNLGFDPVMPIASESDGYWNGSAYLTGLHYTDITLIVDSTMFAQVFDDISYASISKIFFSVPVTVRAIPEPATIALLGMGLTIFIKRARK
jgi:hypothetical protein